MVGRLLLPLLNFGGVSLLPPLYMFVLITASFAGPFQVCLNLHSRRVSVDMEGPGWVFQGHWRYTPAT